MHSHPALFDFLSFSGNGGVVGVGDPRSTRPLRSLAQTVASGAKDLPCNEASGLGDPSLRLKSGFARDDSTENASSEVQPAPRRHAKLA